MSGGTCWSCHGSLEEPPGYRCRAKGPHLCGKRHTRGIETCTLTVAGCKAETMAQRARRLDARPQALRLTAAEILQAIRWHHRPRTPKPADLRWLVVEEVAYLGRRIDALAIDTWGSTGYPRALVAYEIKVDRADWLAELENPAKRAPALELATAFYFAAPRGVIRREEIPEPCGLVEISVGPRGGWRVEDVVPAADLGRPTDPAVAWFVALWLARRLRDCLR